MAGRNLGEGKSSYGYADALVADNSFDLFIFSLNWPTSDCITWKEKNKRNQCYVRE